jgi:hypothetical protein
MEEIKAHKVRNTNGVKSNRTVLKEDFTRKHRKSSPKGVVDERKTIIELRLTHLSRGVMNKKIELWQLESETARWRRDNWEVNICN